MRNRYGKPGTIGNAIGHSALALAEQSARNRQSSFVFMGAVFNLNWLSSREAYVTHLGRDAGIRIFNGVAEFA